MPVCVSAPRGLQPPVRSEAGVSGRTGRVFVSLRSAGESRNLRSEEGQRSSSHKGTSAARARSHKGTQSSVLTVFQLCPKSFRYRYKMVNTGYSGLYPR